MNPLWWNKEQKIGNSKKGALNFFKIYNWLCAKVKKCLYIITKKTCQEPINQWSSMKGLKLNVHFNHFKSKI
ncbi:hypothetical protein BpHYR1_051892 [Brachionus plicatilis]|uniref:Uncharacterized protein n=1 Tax=Brachionus plicatilis TaxID=10195 RepID=A0A3M7RM52_BRAPC|nr:hypothetical protein BpHYR1_051892 [Brachionus plicatilis]